MRYLMLLSLVLLAGLRTPLPAQQPTKDVEPPPGGYTPEKLIEALTKLGYEPTIYGAKKDRCWISLNRGDYRTTVNFSLSNDRMVLWFSCPLSTVAFPAQSPPAALRRMLEENEIISPAHFVFDAADKRFQLVDSLPNHDWTPAKLRAQIERFDDLLRKKEPIWRIDNFLRLTPLPEEATRSEVDHMKGTWKLVEGIQNGVETPADQLAKANVTVTIQGNKLVASTMNAEWTFLLDPSRQPKAVDFINIKSDRVEAGIYKLENDKLTIHLSAVGVERPSNFTIPAGDKRNVLVLQRQNP